MKRKSDQINIDKLDFTSNKINLCAYFYKGSGSKKKPTLIWLQGNPGGPEDGTNPWSIELSKKGVNVFRFNYEGLWGNDGEFNFSNSLINLKSVLDFLYNKVNTDLYQIDTNNLIFGGFSFGSSVVFVGALYDTRIKNIVAVSLCDHGYFGRQFMDPYSKIREFLEETAKNIFLPNGVVNQEKEVFVKDLTDNICRYDFVRHSKKLLKKKILIICGYNDEICPVEDHLLPLYRKLKELGHKDLKVIINDCAHVQEIDLAEVFINRIKDTKS
ncbi:MAG TPA: hypothetical protein PK294_06375 [Ignavibacteria bacterium]|nr:hypothetical protein [Ignavibacteria bacterium]HRB00043.1 hypothetical protein [Ignavibacteria bacterium]